MNVLIVCLQGMTSRVMAQKMTELAKKKADNYVFKAAGYLYVQDQAGWADIILVTPQARAYAKGIKAGLQGMGLQIYQLSAFNEAFNNIPETYEMICRLISGRRDDRICLTGKELARLTKEAALVYLFAAALAGAIYFLYRATGLKDYHVVGRQLELLEAIFAALYLGYGFAGMAGGPRRYYMMVALSALLAFSPYMTREAYVEMETIRFGVFVIRNQFAFPVGLGYIPLVLAMLSLYHVTAFVYERHQRKKEGYVETLGIYRFGTLVSTVSVLTGQMLLRALLVCLFG